MLQDVFPRFADSFFQGFQSRAFTRYSDFRTRIIHQKENNIDRSNKHNQFFMINMQQKKTEVKPISTYINVSDDPLDTVRERIETLPDSIYYLFTELKTFCYEVNEDFLEYKERLTQLHEAVINIKNAKNLNEQDEVEKSKKLSLASQAIMTLSMFSKKRS